MGLIPVKDGEVATIVTTLEMRRKPPLRAMPDSRLRLVEWRTPPLDKYRALFRRIGAPWLWFSRLVMDDARLAGIVQNPDVSIYAVLDPAGVEVGMLELDFRKPGACELSYVGLIPELTGQRHGRWVMAHALTLGWRSSVERVWVHTCTLDHPSALGFYRASGFTAIARTIETFADPRLDGTLPADTAPHIPLLATSRR